MYHPWLSAFVTVGQANDLGRCVETEGALHEDDEFFSVADAVIHFYAHLLCCHSMKYF
jgi:hypothetical protein